MSTSSVFEDVTSVRNATVPQLVVQGTDVGYDVRTRTPFGDRAELIERVAAIAGLALVALALAGLYVGRSYSVHGLGGAHMVAGAVLLTGGVAFLWISARGMRHQTSFDLSKRELHYDVRNRLGTTRALRSVSFDQITESFIISADSADLPAKLYVRIGPGDDLIEVARGSEEELDLLRDRIERDLPKG